MRGEREKALKFLFHTNTRKIRYKASKKDGAGDKEKNRLC